MSLKAWIEQHLGRDQKEKYREHALQPQRGYLIGQPRTEPGADDDARRQPDDQLPANGAATVMDGKFVVTFFNKRKAVTREPDGA